MKDGLIIAGPCTFNTGDEKAIKLTANNLRGVIDIFRVKLWAGGTAPDRWFPGIGESEPHSAGQFLMNLGLPIATEVQTPGQIAHCADWYFDTVWIGARNSQNYGLLQELFNEAYKQNTNSNHTFKNVMLKRGAGMTIDETINLYGIMHQLGGIQPYIIERGITSLDRSYGGRWTADLKIAYVFKHDYPHLFDKLVVDCSHSVGEKKYVEDVYTAFKSIGVKNFMFEVFDGTSKTDVNQILTSDELKKILGR